MGDTLSIPLLQFSKGDTVDFLVETLYCYTFDVSQELFFSCLVQDIGAKELKYLLTSLEYPALSSIRISSASVRPAINI